MTNVPGPTMRSERPLLRRRRASELAPFAQFSGALIPISYLALAAALFANVWVAPATRYAGSIPDALQSIWFLAYTAHAVAHHQSLLFTSLLNAPVGVNLMWNTPMLLLGILISPITLTLGPIVAYNILITLAMAASAWAAFFAIEHLARNRFASWVGGLLFGFSPYMVAQAMGHLDLVFLVYPALMLLIFMEGVVHQRRPWWLLGIALGLLTAAQIFVMEEVVVAVAIAFVIGLIAVALQWPSRVRTHAGYVAKSVAIATVMTVLCAGWPLWYQLTGPQAPPGLSEIANTTGSDLLGFVTPTANQLVSPGIAHEVAARFVAQTTGQDAYLGLPLLLLLGVILWTGWRRPHIRLLAITAAALLVLSLGSQLHVLGRALPVPLPWIVFEHIPLVRNLVPLRLSGFAFLLIAAVVACALAELRESSRRSAVIIGALTALTVITLFPALPRPDLHFTNPAVLPQAVSEAIPDGGTVLFAPLPSLSTADAMYYQARDSFRFALVRGYAYGQSPDLPLTPALEAATPAAMAAGIQAIATPASRAAVVRRYVELRITTIVVPPGDSAKSYTALFAELFQRAPALAGGFAVWSVDR